MAARAMSEMERPQTPIETVHGLNNGPGGHVTNNFGPQAGGAAAKTPYWVGRPATIVDGIVGREGDLTTLEGHVDVAQPTVVCGSPGVGKSRLVAEWTVQAKRPGFWTQGKSSVDLCLVELTSFFGIEPGSAAVEEVAAAVSVRFAALPEGTLWVVDNLPDVETISGLLAQCGGLKLIVTTRDDRRHLLPPSVGFQRLEVLDAASAISLLRSRKRDLDPDDPDLAVMAQKVGNLPIALEALAARLAAPGRSPTGILKEFDQVPNPAQMEVFMGRAQGLSIPLEAQVGVFTALAASLGVLDADMRAGVAPFGYVADAPVPAALALALTGLDDDGLASLMEEAARQSVLRWQDDPRGVIVHALTAGVIAATNAEGLFDSVVDRGQERLAAINQSDPVALRAEVVHHAAILDSAQLRWNENDELLALYQTLIGIGFLMLGRSSETARTRSNASAPSPSASSEPTTPVPLPAAAASPSPINAWA
jgi:hypothetical protein